VRRLQLLMFLGVALPVYAKTLLNGLLYAMLCKEPAAALPAILLAYELHLQRGARLWRIFILRITPFALTFLAYTGLRAWALAGFAPMTNSVTLAPFAYALIILALFCRYLLKLVFLGSLNFLHIFKPPAPLLSADVVMAFLIASLLMAVLFLVQSNRLVLLALAMIVVPLLPVFYSFGLN
jgi:hypothetical protein